ncbi:hypothetical protein E2C01_053513 [Portunus trituberculatus]|uniref:Uncharacterized protein n=1 Tax=Portunus trituberculatus TaxID=210409 RepID=A0A5B7GPK3_PORTR|nr:hypothetical protein [Portunus trituberculatus]
MDFITSQDMHGNFANKVQQWRSIALNFWLAIAALTHLLRKRSFSREDRREEEGKEEEEEEEAKPKKG